MDVRFANDSVFVIAGPSSSGKTHFVSNLIGNSKNLYKDKINRFLWFYGIVPPPASLLLPKSVIFIKGLLKENWSDQIEAHDFVVIDDLFMESGKSAELTNAFTRLAHHRPCTLIYISQNLFQKSPDARTRALNTHYLVMMKNPRDKSQISILARQMYPQNSAFLIDAFKDATNEKPYSYLLLDFRQETMEELRVRTGIFPNETHVVYINNT